MAPERVLIVYFSRTGRTKLLAREIAHKLGCAVEEIKTPRRARVEGLRRQRVREG